MRDIKELQQRMRKYENDAYNRHEPPSSNDEDFDKQNDDLEREEENKRRHNSRSHPSPDHDDVERKIIRALAEQERKLRQQFEAEMQDQIRSQPLFSGNESECNEEVACLQDELWYYKKREKELKELLRQEEEERHRQEIWNLRYREERALQNVQAENRRDRKSIREQCRTDRDTLYHQIGWDSETNDRSVLPLLRTACERPNIPYGRSYSSENHSADRSYKPSDAYRASHANHDKQKANKRNGSKHKSVKYYDSIDSDSDVEERHYRRQFHWGYLHLGMIAAEVLVKTDTTASMREANNSHQEKAGVTHLEGEQTTSNKGIHADLRAGEELVTRQTIRRTQTAQVDQDANVNTVPELQTIEAADEENSLVHPSERTTTTEEAGINHCLRTAKEALDLIL